MSSYTFLTAALAGFVAAQTPVGLDHDVYPRLTTWSCTNAGGCVEQTNSVVIDAGYHWIRQANDSSKGCGDWGSRADPTACPDKETCAKNCIMSGVTDYSNFGVSTNGASLHMDMYNPSGSVSSPRLYLLDKNEYNYEMLQLTGKEFTFDVDSSKLPCGMNGALYLSEMRADGGRSALNPAGSRLGTGYCDAQCFVTPWINGEGNVDGSGVCCNEMDIWEANARSTQIAPHTCGKESLFTCTGAECGGTSAGLCDKNGCGDNPYRRDTTYYGQGLKLDTTKPMTVVTQFPADAEGNLIKIVRKYVQNGIVYENAASFEMTEPYCAAQGGAEQFTRLGNLKGMGGALSRGMVLAFAIWWDQGGNMNWLDANGAGPCNATEGNPSVITQVEPRPAVIYSNIKWGEIGSTFMNMNMTRRAAVHPHMRYW